MIHIQYLVVIYNQYLVVDSKKILADFHGFLVLKVLLNLLD